MGKQINRKNNFIGIREIAEIAGVSTATVSRVINNPSATSDKVRIKVQKVIDEYHYIPNQAIKNIFSKTSNSIAIFIYDMENPFFISVIKHLNRICLEKQYTLLICDTENNTEIEKDYLTYCISNRCSGIILTEGIDSSIFCKHDIGIPLISLDRKISSDFCTIRSENIQSIQTAVDYLYNLNHRRIAFAGIDLDFLTFRERYDGYCKALASKGLPFREEYAYCSGKLPNMETGKNALRHFLSLCEPPTAVICANDMIALGIINEANLLGLRIPDDLSLIGFDNILDNLHYPPITTIKQDIPLIAKRLFDLVANPPEETVSEVLETQFIQGNTCKRIALEEN